MKFDIKNRWTGAVQFTAEISCAEDTMTSVKTGLSLKWAYERGADLRGAVLRGADLTGADLTDADLTGADLTGADLTGADLTGADLTGADLTGADPQDVPIIENIDAKILAAVEQSRAIGKAGLDMGRWHTCQSTHCRAGWAVTLAGEKGAALEHQYGSHLAGIFIYRASRPGKPVPNFFATDGAAMEDLIKCAAEDSAP